MFVLRGENYERLSDLFLPHKNGGWQRVNADLGPDEMMVMSWQEYVDGLKETYTAENIRAFPGAFFNSFVYRIIGGLQNARESVIEYARNYGRDTQAETVLAAVDRIVNVIPEDRRWVLHFWRPVSVDENNYITFKGVDISASFLGEHETQGHTFLSSSWALAAHTIRYSYRGDNFAEHLNEKINSIHEFLSNIRDDLKMGSGQGWYFDTGIIEVLVNRFNFDDSETYSRHRSSDRVYRPSQLAERDDITVALQSQATSWFAKVTVPPRVGDREQLCTILNHSADVLQYLPKNIVGRRKRRDPKTGNVEWVPENDKTTRFFGVELELATDYEMRQLVDAMDEPFAAGKSDATIRGNKRNKIELVTAPMSKRAHRRRWAKFFENVEYRQFDCSKDTDNGLHVHVDLKELGVSDYREPSGEVSPSSLSRKIGQSKHIRNLLWFLSDPANRQFLLWISERTQQQWDRWCPTPPLGSTNRATEYGRIIRTWMDARHQVPNSYIGLRGAANFTRHGTCEIRMFKGFVSYASVMKGIDFTDALINFTAPYGGGREDVRSLRNLNLRSFLDWLDATPTGQYKFVKLFMQEAGNNGRKIAEILAANDVDSVIFSERDPDRIVELFADTGCPVTKHQVAYLNSMFPQKTFDLKNGVLFALVSSKTPLAKHDKSMQSIYARGAKRIEVGASTKRKKGIPQHFTQNISASEVQRREREREVFAHIYNTMNALDVDVA